MPSHDEKRAAELLQAFLGGTIVWRDVPGAAPNTHDFEVQRPNGDIVAVEVTRVTDEAQRAFWNAVAKQQWQACSLKRSWSLVVVPDARIKNLRNQVEPLLRELERLQVCKFGLCAVVPAETAHVVSQLKGLGVKAGRSLDLQPPVILIGTVGGGVTHPDIVSSVVGSVATRSDNRAKLGGAHATERHLFVWIEELAHQVAAAMEAMCSMNIAPSSVGLPGEVDVVWVAKQQVVAGSPDEVLWRFDKLRGWERIK